MAGIQNSILFSNGEKLQISSAQDILEMQEVATDVSRINFSGNPEGVIAANPSSILHDPTSGNFYVKQSGTGNTGWALISTGGGGGGDVSGPGSSTNRAFATWNGTAGTDLFDNPNAGIDSNGYMTNSDQPSFYAYNSANVGNQTGDGTFVTFPFDTLTFERGGSNFNTTTHQYTIPKDGLWTFTFNCYVYNVDVTNNVIQCLLKTNATSYRLYELNAVNLNIAGEIILNGSWSALVSAGNTVECVVVVGGAAKNVGLAGGATLNAFSGRLVA